MSSIDSSPAALPVDAAPVSNEARLTPEQSLQEQMELHAGVARLLEMSAVQSIHRNLKREDDAVERDIQAHERMLHGEPGDAALPVADPLEPDMEIMAARDVHVYQPGIQPPAYPPTPSYPPPTAVVPATAGAPVVAPPARVAPATVAATAPATAAPSRLSNLAKAGLVAAGLAIGAPAAAVGTYLLTKDEPPAAVVAPAPPTAEPYEPPPQTKYELHLLPPDTRTEQ